MRALRRRLASFALALAVCHSALVFAGPLASCCPSRAAAAAAADDECCPAGSHPPGQCPRHAGSNASSRAERSGKTSCRLQCDAPHGAQFLLGAVGLLPVSALSIAAPDASHAAANAVVNPETRPFVPDAPPPRA